MIKNLMIEIETKHLKTEYPKFEDFTYWYYRIDDTHFKAVDKKTDNVVGILKDDNVGVDFVTNHDANVNVEVNSLDVVSDFKCFKNRPEYLIGNIYEEYSNLAEYYNKLLLGSLLIRTRASMVKAELYENDIDDITPKIERCINWLESTDFYEAPASTRFHESFNSGLLTHTLNVVKQCYHLSQCKQFQNIDYASMTLVSLVHDWCKIGQYESYMKNVKDDKTGTWHKEEAYKVKERTFSCLGHGVTSLVTAQRFFNLTTEELCAVRWHMGAWRVADSEYNELQQANEIYPLVHLLQFADQLSITDYANSNL